MSLLEEGGLLLGVFPEATYERGEARLLPGDFVAMYTDGLTEASNPQDELFSEELVFEDEVHGFYSEENRIRFYEALDRFLAQNLAPRPKSDAVPRESE